MTVVQCSAVEPNRLVRSVCSVGESSVVTAASAVRDAVGRSVGQCIGQWSAATSH